VQRFGGALNINVHFHTLVLDGVFTTAGEARLQFRPLPPPTDTEVEQLVTTIRARVLRLLARRGLGPDAEVERADPVAEESPALAGLSVASVQGRVALGPRAGARALALGRDPEAQWVMSGGPRHAHLDGFDLHANVTVRGEDRQGLEQLCRYLLRPAVAQDRLRLTAEGRVVLQLKTAWSDGTSHLVFEPVDFLARLAALIPRPRINLVFYHGVLAPRATRRAGVVAYAAEVDGAVGGECRRDRPSFRRGAREPAIGAGLDLGPADAARVRPGRAGLSGLRRSVAADRPHLRSRHGPRPSGLLSRRRYPGRPRPACHSPRRPHGREGLSVPAAGRNPVRSAPPPPSVRARGARASGVVQV
jgi:hypothetical protein